MDTLRFETPGTLVLLHIGSKEALVKSTSNLPLNQSKQTRHIYLIEGTSFAEHLSLYKMLSEETCRLHDISVIPAPEESMVEFFIENLKRTLKDLELTKAKEVELEQEVTRMHDKEVAEEYMEYQFGWTRRKASRFIEEHDIRNLRELIDRPQLVGGFERERLKKLTRLCKTIRSDSVRRSSSYR